MRIRSVTANARRKAFEVVVPGKTHTFPQTNYGKTVDQLLRFLNVLDCDVELVVRAKAA